MPANKQAAPALVAAVRTVQLPWKAAALAERPSAPPFDMAAFYSPSPSASYTATTAPACSSKASSEVCEDDLIAPDKWDAAVVSTLPLPLPAPACRCLTPISTSTHECRTSNAVSQSRSSCRAWTLCMH